LRSEKDGDNSRKAFAAMLEKASDSSYLFPLDTFNSGLSNKIHAKVDLFDAEIAELLGELG
jgi:hypothetical protein